MPAATMRAIQISEFGGPEVLEPVRLPIPEPGPSEVLIEVSSAGVNFADTHSRTGSYVGQAPLPLVPGGEVAGRIIRAPGGGGGGAPGAGRGRGEGRRAGEGQARRADEGQARRAQEGQPLGEGQARQADEGRPLGEAQARRADEGRPLGEAQARRADEGRPLGEGQRVVALTGTGGYAQYATAPAAHVWAIPDGVDDGTALALVIQGTTAWHLYRTAGRVAAGESVVVHSAAGGVGSLAVQLGHAFGAGRVIGTASSPERRELALELGADAAADPAPEGLTERLIEAAGGEPVDVVFDMAGGATFDASYAALAHFGRIVVCGISGERPNEVRTGSLLRHSRAVVGFYLFHCLERPGMFARALEDLFARVARGELRALVGGTYPLGEAARAHVDLRARRTAGKLLLDPAA